jgi:hypothetical protein
VMLLLVGCQKNVPLAVSSDLATSGDSGGGGSGGVGGGGGGGVNDCTPHGGQCAPAIQCPGTSAYSQYSCGGDTVCCPPATLDGGAGAPCVTQCDGTSNCAPGFVCPSTCLTCPCPDTCRPIVDLA